MPFEVVPDDLVAHASHLDGLVERLNTVVSAAASAMSDDAYGLLCAFLPPIVNPTGERAADVLKAAVEGIQTSADNVRTAASSYQEGDDSNAAPFLRHIGPGLATGRVAADVGPSVATGRVAPHMGPGLAALPGQGGTTGGDAA
jgi:hypothetical protein